MSSLLNRVAVVTGGAGGIGTAIARSLLEMGATVACVDLVHAGFIDQLPHETKSRASSWICNVTDAKSVSDVCESIVRMLGAVTILINVAGGSGNLPAQMPEETSDEMWDEIMSLNVTSVLRFSRALVPHMKAEKFGRIINVSSTLRDGVFGPVGTLGARLPYVTAKAALIGMTRQLAKDLGQFGITANVISPGLTLPGEDSRIAKRFRALTPEGQARLTGHIPTGSPATGEDIAYSVAMLMAPAAGQINGQTIDIDGGA